MPAPLAAPVIVWFRRDLRLADNPALHGAAASGRPVIPIYVLDEAAGVRPFGGALKWWLDKSLVSLAASLDQLGSRLILRRGDASKIVAQLAEETGAGAVAWNRLTDPGAPERDASLQAALERCGVEVSTHNAAFLVEPGTLTNGSGQPYKVFTSFWRAARSRISHPEVFPQPRTLTAPERWPASDRLESWGLHPTRPDWSKGFDEWTPGEVGAGARLDRFVDEVLDDYTSTRDRPGLEGSSRLSPHLRWGEIGPRQVWAAGEHALVRRHGAEAQAEKFFAEMGWREFNNNTLLARPDLASADFKPGFSALPWRRDPGGFTAWTRGLTGYPIVDAGMRQLWAEGWMHNRVRLIAASFLVKHVLIDWREGETWFWDTLVDADPANNAANWQWVAGTGADASPFFRIFNPVAQGEKFDPEGAYVRRWVPELGRLPDRFIHAPWTAPEDVLATSGVQLGRTYPHPIVEHAAARRRALEAFAAVRRG
jgi:deoxyribodipyrimidine photo-lyase